MKTKDRLFRFYMRIERMSRLSYLVALCSACYLGLLLGAFIKSLLRGM